MSPMTRRQFLITTGLASAGVTLGGPIASALCNYEKPAAKRVASTAASAYTPVAPFSVTAHSNLSEDHFMSSEIAVDQGNDYVVSVVREDGTLAIFIVPTNGGAVSMVAPDSSSPSGYSVSTLAELGPVKTTIAAGPPGPGAESSGALALLYGSATSNQLTTTMITAKGSVDSPSDYEDELGTATTPPRSIVGSDGFGYSAVVNSDGAGKLYWGQAGGPVDVVVPLNGMPPRSDAHFALSDSGTVTVLALVDDPVHVPSGVVIGMGDPQPSPGIDVRGLELPAGMVADEIWGPPLPMSVPDQPTAAVAVLWVDDVTAYPYVGLFSGTGQLVGQPIQLLSEERFGLQVNTFFDGGWFQSPDGTITVYLLAALEGDGTGDASSTLYKQTIDFASDTPDSAPIPLQDGVYGMYLPEQGLTDDTALTLVTPSTQFVGSCLTSLSRRSSDGIWVTAPIHTAQPTFYPIDTYRTMLTVTDATGTPVPGANVYITPELDVLAFRTTGGVPLPAGTETTVQADDWGQVCVASAATALHASTLTVRCDVALPSGNATVQRTPPTLVSPDGEVHGFLSGATPLNKYGTVQDLLSDPGANTFASIQGDPKAIGAIASAVNAAVTSGLNSDKPPNSSANLTPFQLSGLDTNSPTYTTIETITHPKVTSGVGSIFDRWAADLANDAKSLWKAIEQGLAKVSNVVHGWDGKNWFVDLALEIKGVVTTIGHYVIDGVKAAISAVHGILQAIGADIAAVIKLIRTLVSDIMQDTESIADTLYSWISYDPANPGNAGLAVARAKVDDLLNEAKSATNGFFGRAENDLTTEIQKLTATTGNLTPNASKAKATTNIPPSHAPATSTAHNSRTTWLLEKSRSTPVSSSISPASAVSAGTAALATTLGAKTAPTASAKSAAQGLPSTKDLLDHFDMATLTAMLSEVMVDGLKFLDDIVIDILTAMEGAVDDLSAAIRMPLSDVPIIDLLATVFHVDISEFTIGKLICLVLGFGIAVVGDLVYGGNSWLPKPVGSSLTPRTHALSTKPSLRTQQPSWEIFIDLSNAVVYAFSIIPTVAEAAAAVEGDEPPLILQIIDMVFGVAENALAFPFGTPPDSGSVLAWDATQTDANKFFGAATPIYSWLLGFVPVAVQIIAAKASVTAAGQRPTPEPSPEKVFVETVQLVLLSAIGLVNLAIDIAVTALSETGGADITVGVLLDVFAWVPTALSFLLLEAADPAGPPVWAVIAIASPIVVLGCEIAELATV